MKKQNAAYSVLGRITKLLIAVMVIMLVYVVALKAYDFGYRIFAERPASMAPGTDVTVEIIIHRTVVTNTERGCFFILFYLRSS